jgi:hypothetical protein
MFRDFIILDTFRSQLRECFDETGIRTDLTDDNVRWNDFVRHYAGVIEDGSLALKPQHQVLKHVKQLVERVVDPVEAAVVLRVFPLYDSGLGLKRIAALLTSEEAPASLHMRRVDGLLPAVGWSPSTVRGVLTRETYHGVVVWNKTRKKDSYGAWAPTDRPKAEWITAAARQ